MGTSPTTYEIDQDDAQPSVLEIQQEPLAEPFTVPVQVTNPVRVNELPCRNAAAFTTVISSTTPVQILNGPDLKRKRVWINCDGDILVAFTPNTGAGARLHGAAAVQGVLDLTYVGNIFIALPTGTTPVNVGTIVEYWAD